ncbi:hypothetical protein TNIN_493511 [Trichonephila inaurata madagascariensis]|uniref:Uncharacterized protein n=1 Tax=Trichonephila inaurata madagascariensis TaxID=2747483 RepID=A0A8X6YH48_9ARAC|nr:hypothetical protein TNIN_493511 [Trichonephila inaurata madagascariensis]
MVGVPGPGNTIDNINLTETQVSAKIEKRLKGYTYEIKLESFLHQQINKTGSKQMRVEKWVSLVAITRKKYIGLWTGGGGVYGKRTIRLEL